MICTLITDPLIAEYGTAGVFQNGVGGAGFLVGIEFGSLALPDILGGSMGAVGNGSRSRI